jgi:hypothetical protein
VQLRRDHAALGRAFAARQIGSIEAEATRRFHAAFARQNSTGAFETPFQTGSRKTTLREGDHRHHDEADTMTMYAGGCHCGNVRLAFSTELDPSQVEVRACQCSFCVRHGSRAIADPDGRLIISVKDEAQLRRYQFGLRTADYLICRECGVYVAAIARDDARAIVIVNALDDRDQFNQAPVLVDFDAESRVQRQARRRTHWMPVEMGLE